MNLKEQAVRELDALGSPELFKVGHWGWAKPFKSSADRRQQASMKFMICEIGYRVKEGGNQ